MTVEEAEKLDPDDRNIAGITFYKDERKRHNGILWKDGHYGLMDKDGAVRQTERIDFKELYIAKKVGPVYKGYPISAFIKGT